MNKKRGSFLGLRLAKADLHIHSRYSDGAATPAQIFDFVEHHTDLDVIAISDHDTMEGAYEAKKLYKEGHYRFEFILAQEVTTDSGHILAAFIKEPIEANLPLRQALYRIRKQRGIAVAAHPFMHTRLSHDKYATMDGIGATALLNNNDLIDAVEIVNATPFLADENIAASVMNKTLLFNAEVGNSDAHILEAIGHGYTLFEGKSAKDLKKAILQHQTRAMFHEFTLLALFKYGYFFFPRGLRMLINTLTHGKKDRKPDELENELLTKYNGSR